MARGSTATSQPRSSGHDSLGREQVCAVHVLVDGVANVGRRHARWKHGQNDEPVARAGARWRKVRLLVSIRPNDVGNEQAAAPLITRVEGDSYPVHAMVAAAFF